MQGSNSLSFLLRTLSVVIRWKFQRFGYAVDLAVVAVELIKLNGFGLVDIDEIKNSLNLLMLEGAIQPFHDLLELIDNQLSAFVSIVS